MRVLAICLLIVILCVPAAYATKQLDCGDKEITDYTWYHAHCYEDKDTIHHDHRDDPAGIGVDVLVHETEHADIVAEYKYDFANEENSIFGVVRTKTSVVELVKKLVKKIKGDDAQ